MVVLVAEAAAKLEALVTIAVMLFTIAAKAAKAAAA